MTQNKSRLSNPLTLGLALLAGGGLIVMIIALGVGVALPDADSFVFTGLMLLGVAALVLGIIGWAVAVRPSAHFDDINIPKDIHTHTGEHDNHDTHGALVIADTTAVETHAPSHS